MKTDNEKYNESVQPNTFFLENLKSKLPDFFSKDGKFDLDKFKSQLQEHNIDELKDGYQLNFIGKDYARRQAGEMPSTVIVPDEIQNNGEGKNSKNLFFTGDNLEVLRHLQTNYAGKVEVIFISVDDNEDGNLKEICDEIFGESNFLAQVVWERAYAPINLKKNFSPSHDYMLVYGRDANVIETNGIARNADTDSSYGNLDNDPRGDWRPDNLSVGPAIPANIYPVTTPSGRVVEPPAGRSWSLSQQAFYERLADNRIWFGKNGDAVPSMKRFKSELRKSGVTPMTVWQYKDVGHSQEATQKLQELMGGKKYFTYPKPVKLVQRAIQLYSNEDSIILDFFAGSATTAEAVMKQNMDDGGHRRFIMVQLPEKTYKTNEDGTPKLKDGRMIPTKGGRSALEDGYMSIDEISRERIRRAATKIREDNNLPEDFDGSFKHYRVVEPTRQTLEEVEDFDINNTDLFNDMVSSFSSDALNVAGNASGEQTIRTTWLAKDGYSFDADVKKVDFAGYEASLVEGSRLYLINDGWTSKNTEDLLNKLGTHQLTVQTIVLFGYSFNIAELRELEIGLKQLDVNINLLKRY